MKTLALTGATGFIGKTTIKVFTQNGWNIKALYRTKHPNNLNVNWIEGDLSNQKSLNELTKGANLVIHLAGIVEAKSWKTFNDINVEGTRNLVNSALLAKVDNFLFISSLAATKPTISKYGKSKYIAENIVKSEIDRYNIIRPPAVYGNDDRDFPKIFKYAENYGVIPQVFKGKVSIIDVDDLANLFLSVANSTHCARNIFEPDDGKIGGWSHIQITREIGRAMKRLILPMPLPKAAFYSYAAQQIKANGYTEANLTPDRARYMVNKNWVANPLLAPPQDLWQPKSVGKNGIKLAYEAYRTSLKNSSQ